LPVAQTFEAVDTGSGGLTSTEAKARLEKYGYNELEKLLRMRLGKATL